MHVNLNALVLLDTQNQEPDENIRCVWWRDELAAPPFLTAKEKTKQERPMEKEGAGNAKSIKIL